MYLISSIFEALYMQRAILMYLTILTQTELIQVFFFFFSFNSMSTHVPLIEMKYQSEGVRSKIL